MVENIRQIKIAIFWDEIFNNNDFRNTNIDINLTPFLDLSKSNSFDSTISLNLLKDKKDKDEYIILCFLNFSIFSLHRYIHLFFIHRKNKKYLFLFEPPVVSPLSYIKIFHILFNKIYTWNDDLVDNKKYYKFIYPQSNHNIVPSKDFNNKKFITLMNGNKFSL